MDDSRDTATLSTMRELYYIVRPHRWTFVLVLGLSIVLSCLNMVVPYSLKLAVDTITDGEGLTFLFVIAGGVLTIYVVKNGVYYLSKSKIVELAEQVAFDLRSELMAHMHRLSVRYYQQQKPGRISSRLIQDVESIKEFISSEFTKLFINAMMLLVGIVIIITLNPLLAAVALILLPLDVVIYYLFKGSITESAKKAKERISTISGDLVEQFSGVETMKSAVSEEKEREKFAVSMRKGMTAHLRERKFYLLQKISADMVVGLSLFLLFCVGGYLVIEGPMTTAEFVAFYAYIGLLYPEAIKLVSDAGKFASTRASFDRVYEILRTSPDVPEHSDAQPYFIKRGSIKMRGVSFRYNDQPLLKDVNFSIDAGEHVLITGPSGCGKSTLLNLIPRFYDPDAGEILLDGTDQKRFTLKALRAQIGFVFQDCFLFNISVLENIRYARPDATNAEVVVAAKRANAHEFIRELPDQYLTRIGEGGVQLSFGERQRIGIARAFLKDPRIFIFDEALASLDPEGRASIADELEDIVGDRTMLVVTHNPSLFKGIDKELHFEGSKVVVRNTASRI